MAHAATKARDWTPGEDSELRRMVGAGWSFKAAAMTLHRRIPECEERWDDMQAGRAVYADTSDTSKSERDRDKPGLTYLYDKGMIGRAEYKAGRLYGQWWQGASLAGGEPLRSCLDDTVRGAAGGGGLPTHATQEWIAECRDKQGRVMAFFEYQAVPTWLLNEVCGKGRRPRDLVGDMRALRPELKGSDQSISDDLTCTLGNELRRLSRYLEGKM